MSWSVQQLANVSGVTARTLRYYDEIDLLRPARVGANGYRHYEREQLLRLQQILLYRELGLNLTTIADVIDDEHDPVEALGDHHRRLADEAERLGRLTKTVAATIRHLREGTDMPMADMFRAMTPERAEYLAGLPKKRTAAGVLLCDEHGRTLLMEPTYKPYWQLPGCVVAADESPLSATSRAIRERLGLSIVPGRLLVADWVSPTESRIEGLLFVYAGVAPLSPRQSQEIVLSPAFRSWAWCTEAELEDRMPPHMFGRTRAARLAHAEGTSLYLEDGSVAV